MFSEVYGVISDALNWKPQSQAGQIAYGITTILSFYIILVAAFYALKTIGSRRFSAAELRERLFPTNVYRHPAAVAEYKIAPAIFGLQSLIGLLGIGGAALSATAVSAFLSSTFAGPKLQDAQGIQFAALILVYFLVHEFTWYLWHSLQHKVPFLWRFHRFHHSAEVMTLVTGLVRTHPIDAIMGGLFTATVRGTIMGTYFFLSGYIAPIEQLFAAFVVATFPFAVLTPFYHSSKKLSFGPLDRIFMSPSSHHVHHGLLRHHWDKNMGGVLAIWDWLFGTLYLPRKDERFPLGLRFEERGEFNPHWTLKGALLEPITSAWYVLTRRHDLEPGKCTRLHWTLDDGSEIEYSESSEAEFRRLELLNRSWWPRSALLPEQGSSTSSPSLGTLSLAAEGAGREVRHGDVDS